MHVKSNPLHNDVNGDMHKTILDLKEQEAVTGFCGPACMINVIQQLTTDKRISPTLRNVN